QVLDTQVAEPLDCISHRNAPPELAWLFDDERADHATLAVAWDIAIELILASGRVDGELRLLARLHVHTDSQLVNRKVVRQRALIAQRHGHLGVRRNRDLRRVELQLSRLASNHLDSCRTSRLLTICRCRLLAALL